MDAEFIRLQLQLNNIKKINNRKLIWVYPSGMERTYRERLLKYVDGLKFLYRDVVDSKLTRIIKLRSMKFDRDDWSDELNELINDLSSLYGTYHMNNYKNLIGDIPGDTNKFNKTQWMKFMMFRLGINLLHNEIWLGDLLKSWVYKNAQLIKGLSDDIIKNISVIINDGVLKGIRHEELRRLILAELLNVDGKSSVFRKIYNRAKLISRDQVSKLNADLTRFRQEEIGIKRYTWKTSLDERVRPNHRTKEGKIFHWDNPPSDTGHPGEDYQCRCWGDPIFSDLQGLESFK